MSRSLKSALAVAALVVTLGLSGGPAAAVAGPVHFSDGATASLLSGGATGCCRIAV